MHFNSVNIEEHHFAFVTPSINTKNTNEKMTIVRFISSGEDVALWFDQC